MKCQPSFSTNFLFPTTTLHLEKRPQLFYHRNRSSQRFPPRSFETGSDGRLSDEGERVEGREDVELVGDAADGSSGSTSHVDDEYPSGEFVYSEYDLWQSLVVKFRMLIAWPWERVKKGSVLTIKLRGEVPDCFLLFSFFFFGYCSW